MVNGSRNFSYDFYQRLGVNFAPIDGGFYSNDNNQNPSNINHFIISKYNNKFKDLSGFFNGITTTNPFDLILTQKTGLNSIFFFSITDVELINDYYKLFVTPVFFVAGNIMNFKESNLAFNLKPNTLGVHNNLSGLNDGDFKHLTALEKTYFDSIPTALNLKVDKVTGKSLLSDTEILRLLTLNNFDNSVNIISLALKQDILIIKTISGSVTIDATFNNNIALQKATATITLPSGLGANFNFVIRRFASTTTTFVAGAGVAISSEGDGTSFTGKGMISVFCDGANNFIIAGQ